MRYILLSALLVMLVQGLVTPARSQATSPNAAETGAAETGSSVVVMMRDDHCANIGAPQSSFDISLSGPTEDRSHSYRALSLAGNGDKGPATKRNGVAFGQTQTRTSLAILPFNGTLMKKPNGLYCMWATHVTAQITWGIEVWIAAEVKPGSCADGAVRGHEAKHVAISKQFQANLLAYLQAAVAAKARYTVLVNNPNEGERILGENLHRLILDSMKSYIADLDKQEGALDTPQEYQRVLSACGANTFKSLVKPGL